PETIEAARPVDIETTSPVETRAPSSAGSSSGNLILTFVLAGLAVVVVLVALAVLLWRKQRDLEKADEEEADQLTPPEAPPAEDKPELPSLAELKRRLHFEREPQSEDPMPDLDLNIPIRQPDNIPGCRVRLVPQDHPAGVVEFTIGVNESVTLGRNQRADIVLSETDRALSSLHFELQWDSRVLHLRDRKSTNGTALNGVPLRPEVWARVENKAAIQAGATRYTVFVEKK
ncbi:MAG: FHA domain-containing protein, partial [Faecousia sp.]